MSSWNQDWYYGPNPNNRTKTVLLWKTGPNAGQPVTREEKTQEWNINLQNIREEKIQQNAAQWQALKELPGDIASTARRLERQSNRFLRDKGGEAYRWTTRTGEFEHSNLNPADFGSTAQWLTKKDMEKLKAKNLPPITDTTTNQTTNQETAETIEAKKINEYSGIQNIPTGFKTKAGSKVTRSYTPDQMKEWEEKGGDMTPDDYFSRKHLQDSGKNIEWSTDQKTNEGFTFQQNAKTNDELKPKFGKDGTVTKNLQIASAVLEGIKKLQPQKEAVNINWSNPYDEDNIRGYTGTWA